MGDSIVTEWEELAQEYKNLEVSHQKYLNKLKELTAAQNSCLNIISHQRKRLAAINKSIKQTISTDKLREIKNEAIRREAQLQLLEETLPRRAGKFLQIILGNVDVGFLSPEAKFKYKDGYETFKLICHIVAFILVILNMLTSWRVFELVYLFFLVWYYCTMAIRESILRANGSKIKTWWRVHHVLSVVASGVLLVWPENQAWNQFKGQFFRYNLYNCLVQYLQFKYQRGALYKLKALGQKDNMDITIEGFRFWMWRGLAFLFPFLFISYFYQLYNAYRCYILYYSHPESSWHVMATCILMLVFFLGNSITTVMVIPNKIKNKMLMQYKVMTRTVNEFVSEKIPLSKSETKSD